MFNKCFFSFVLVLQIDLKETERSEKIVGKYLFFSECFNVSLTKERDGIRFANCELCGNRLGFKVVILLKYLYVINMI